MKKITSKLLLRIAAIIVLLHSIGHTVGFSGWQKQGGVVPPEVINIMKEKHFAVQGRETTMADSFTGSGYTVSIFLLLLVGILWLTSNGTRQDKTGILWLTASALTMLSLVEFIFYFPAVAVLSLISAILAYIAVLKSTNHTQA
jgi:hypothetical protein